MKKIFQSNLTILLILFLASVLICVAIYPEVFINFKSTFMLWSDYCIEYPLSFVLTGFFYQGGLQLWNYFGQMPYFHTYAVEGLFKLPNVMTAVIFYLLQPFSGDSGRLFQHVFTWANFFTLLLIRMAGIFALLKIVTKNRVILTVGTVMFAVFFSQLAFLRGTFYMSCFPLGMYFVVRFFQGLEWRYFIAAFLFLIVCLGSGVLHGAYLYLPMHFFIIAGIVWRVFFYTASNSPVARPFWHSWAWRDLVWVLPVAFFILVPYVYIVKYGFPDLAFGQANSRISHPFSPQWYFHNPDLDLGTPSTFFSMGLNPQSFDMYYLGISFIFLALAGLILNRNNLKWFFGLGIFFLWMLSFPREGFNLGFLAHWVNVLTNPLKTLPRSYVYACQPMFACLLMPLAVMGIEAMRELYGGQKYLGFKLVLLGAMTWLLVLNGIPVLPTEISTYLIISAVLLSGGLAWVQLRNSSSAMNFLAVALCLLVVIDLLFIVYQTKNRFVHQYARKPILFDVSPQAGMVVYDYQNPSIFPFRYTYTLHFSFRDQTVLWSPHGIASDMYHVINQGLHYVYLNGYTPRHAEFAKFFNDPPMLAYLKQNDQFIFLAPTAINASPDGLTRIASAGLAKQVVEVEDPNGILKLPTQWPENIKVIVDDIQYDQIAGTLEDDGNNSEYQQQGDMIIYTLHLLSSFPQHLASSWFAPEERYLRFFVQGAQGSQWQEFQAVQGDLIRPYTFDVQNIKKGQLKAAFPKDDFPMHHKAVLLYPSSENEGVEGLWHRQFDNLGLTYRAKRDGWWVIHYPYDPKFKITVDGKPVTYYRVDESFIGFPMPQGEHKILIQYWPGSPLRLLLLTSLVLTSLGFPVLIFLAMKWEQS